MANTQRQPAQVIRKGVCKCIAEPSGEGGLEGFNINDDYDYEFMDRDKNDRPYYRLYLQEDYYETCGKGTFNKFFEEITPL
jgi:hypothetical protein